MNTTLKTLLITSSLLLALFSAPSHAQPPIAKTLPGGITLLPNEHPLSPEECQKLCPPPEPVDSGLVVDWGPTYFVSDANYFGLCPRLSITKDFVYVVYLGQGHTEEKPYLCTSLDRGGGRWHTQDVLNGPTNGDGTPAVAGLGRTVHVVGTHQINSPAYQGVFYWRSSDAGLSFNAQLVPLIQSGFHPSVSVMGNFVNVIGMSNYKLMHCLSVNGGHGFLTPDSLAPCAEGGQPTRLAVCQNYVYAAFLGRCYSTNQVEIYFTRSADYGRTFAPYVMLSSMDQFHSQWPSLGCSEDGDVYVAWYDYKYTPYSMTGDILLRISHDFGGSFGEECQVTTDNLEQSSMIAVQDSQVHVAYEKYAVGTMGESEIYYRNSADRGATWSAETRLTYAHDNSSQPDLAVKNDTLHLVWHDERYFFTVFYRRGIVQPARRLSAAENHEGAAPTMPLTVHPNPFNPKTTLSFILPEAARVILKVYDLRGAEVATLVNGVREAGQHQVVFDGSNLASGVYLYRLSAGNFTICGKLMLLK
jgi:hypothetical protein